MEITLYHTLIHLLVVGFITSNEVFGCTFQKFGYLFVIILYYFSLNYPVEFLYISNEQENCSTNLKYFMSSSIPDKV